MSRREYLKRVALGTVLAALTQVRLGAARQRFDELCDERGVCLVLEDGVSLVSD
jgi:hypothetical protein